MKTCPYCAETDLADEAIVCKHCGKEIGPGHALKDTAKKMEELGCALTLLITVPVVLLIVFASMC